MAKRRRRSDASRLRAGGGTGHGEYFIAFIKTRDVPSLGLASRIPGIKTGRPHHLLSNVEKRFFFILDFSPHVVDIREQFPLPLNETIDICRRFNLRHPCLPITREPAVMTSDFLIDEYIDGFQKKSIRTVKPSSKLTSLRTLEKLEIEKIYWRELDVDWGIIIDTDLPFHLCRNLEWLHPAYFPAPSQQFPHDVKVQVEWLLFELSAIRYFTPFTDLAHTVDKRLGLPPGSALWLARHFLATKVWTIDLRVPLRLNLPLRITRNTEAIHPLMQAI